MTQSILDLKEAIVSELSGDATLQGLVTGVFDHVPEGNDYPYVVIGNSQEEDHSSVSKKKTVISLVIKTFSRSRGSKLCLQIMNRIYELLNDADLSLSNETLLSIRFSKSEVHIKSDGLTYEGLSQFKAVIEG